MLELAAEMVAAQPTSRDAYKKASLELHSQPENQTDGLPQPMRPHVNPRSH